MATYATFVHPFTSSWIRPGILRRGRTHLSDFRDSEYERASPASRTSSSRVTVTSNLSARRFLLHNRRAGFESETVYYNSTEEPNEQEDQKEPEEHEAEQEHEEAERPTEPKPETPVVIKRTGMNSPVVLSEELQKFAGDDIMARSKVLSLLGDYIKENNLYLKGNKRRFVTDHFLSNLLGVNGDQPLLALQPLISKHLRKPADVGPEYVERSERMYQQYLKERGAVDSKMVSVLADPRGLNSSKTQRELKAKGKGMYKAVTVDPCLRPILGGHASMSRPQILQTVWKYIKEKNLQDPQNRRRIIISEDLRKALKVTDADTIDCFHVGRYLWKLCKDPAEK